VAYILVILISEVFGLKRSSLVYGYLKKIKAENLIFFQLSYIYKLQSVILNVGGPAYQTCFQFCGTESKALIAMSYATLHVQVLKIGTRKSN
jgi:hypothetical protein